jgi:hypothetical protein
LSAGRIKGGTFVLQAFEAPNGKGASPFSFLKPSSYNYKSEYSKINLPRGEQMGFIAQDMEKVFSQLVKTVVDKEEDNEKAAKYQNIDYIGLILLLFLYRNVVSREHNYIQTSQRTF